MEFLKRNAVVLWFTLSIISFLAMFGATDEVAGSCGALLGVLAGFMGLSLYRKRSAGPVDAPESQPQE